jgi:hypothetical protein
VADVLPEKIVWYLLGDAQASVTQDGNGIWSWHWVPGGTREGTTRPGFTSRDEAIGAARTALGEAGITLEQKIGERRCLNCGRSLFDHDQSAAAPGRCPPWKGPF